MPYRGPDAATWPQAEAYLIPGLIILISNFQYQLPSCALVYFNYKNRWSSLANLCKFCGWYISSWSTEPRKAARATRRRRCLCLYYYKWQATTGRCSVCLYRPVRHGCGWSSLCGAGSFLLVVSSSAWRDARSTAHADPALREIQQPGPACWSGQATLNQDFVASALWLSSDLRLVLRTCIDEVNSFDWCLHHHIVRCRSWIGICRFCPLALRNFWLRSGFSELPAFWKMVLLWFLLFSSMINLLHIIHWLEATSKTKTYPIPWAWPPTNLSQGHDLPLSGLYWDFHYAWKLSVFCLACSFGISFRPRRWGYLKTCLHILCSLNPNTNRSFYKVNSTLWSFSFCPNISIYL